MGIGHWALGICYDNSEQLTVNSEQSKNYY